MVGTARKNWIIGDLLNLHSQLPVSNLQNARMLTCTWCPEKEKQRLWLQAGWFLFLAQSPSLPAFGGHSKLNPEFGAHSKLKPWVWSVLQTQTPSLERTPNSTSSLEHSPNSKKMRAECFFQFKQPLCTHIFSQKNLVHAYFFWVWSKLQTHSKLVSILASTCVQKFLVKLHQKKTSSRRIIQSRSWVWWVFELDLDFRIFQICHKNHFFRR